MAAGTGQAQRDSLADVPYCYVPGFNPGTDCRIKFRQVFGLPMFFEGGPIVVGFVEHKRVGRFGVGSADIKLHAPWLPLEGCLGLQHDGLVEFRLVFRFDSKDHVDGTSWYAQRGTPDASGGIGDRSPF